jgi:hypothetical protein
VENAYVEARIYNSTLTSVSMRIVRMRSPEGAGNVRIAPRLDRAIG